MRGLLRLLVPVTLSVLTAAASLAQTPVITAFTVADPNPLFGAETTLSWTVADATSVSINQGIGTVPVNGTVSITPLQTTTYTLTALNANGATTATVTVNQPAPIGVASPGFTARRVSSTVAFPFAGQTYLGSALSVLAGQNAGNQTTQTYPTVNFADGVDGDFPSGNTTFPGGSGDNFAMRVTATLVVNTPGEYVFVVNTDDGARLRIDGQDVIVDDGTHAPSASSGRVVLNKSTVELELIYFDATGAGAVELGWIRPNFTWQLLGVIQPAAPNVHGKLLISEFMAENGNGLRDEDGQTSDWVEIWNSTTASIDLTGHFLTDDPTVPNKWALPNWTLDANNHLVAFASLKDRRPPQTTPGQDNAGTMAQPRLHTNFRLSKFGGYLALTRADGAGGFSVVSDFTSYPVQRENISYGSSDAEGYIGYMETPTPGQTNAVTYLGFVADTKFSQPRGRYSAAFDLAITTETPEATIRYTLDGSTPTASRGIVYTGPIRVTGTRVIRAAAFKRGWKSTNVDSHSYLFVNDIATQTTSTATAIGFPAGSVAPRNQVFRYGMNFNNVTSAQGTAQSLRDALAAAPSVCLNTDVANLVSPATGIYANADKRGLFWERPASLEYISAAGTSEFQIDCGVRTRGGFSRDANNPKHAFHLYFRGSLYDGDLKYRLFGATGASRFDQLDMRTEQNYSWSYGNDSRNTLIREEWSRLTQRDMGQPYARTGYFHLYLNGIYWGVFNWEERTEADYGATYLGGNKEDQDVVKSAGSSGGYNTEMTDGNFTAWQTLHNLAVALKNSGTETLRTARYMQMQGLNPDGTRNPNFPVLLDPDNLIDYNLVVFYDGSFDSPLSTFLSNGSNNWFGIRNRLGTRGFAFFAHDHEHGMDSNGRGSQDSYNRVGPWGGSGTNNWGQGQYGTRETFLKSNPQYLHELLAYSAEYRQRFADRVQRHFFNGGALTQQKAIARVNELAGQVDKIIHAEAARWGSTSLNRNAWLSAKTAVDNFINRGGTPQSGQTQFAAQPRNSLVIQQLQGYTDNGPKPLFPTLAAPTFNAPFGGPVSMPHSVVITNPSGNGTLYYTVNGVDPRAPGGGIAATALTGESPTTLQLNSTATVRARVFDPATQQWSALTEAEFLVGVLASPANLVISKIHYNPPGDTDLTEFIEVMNVSAAAIDLTNVRFSLGVQFDFPDGFQLQPGHRALIVRNLAAFTAAYPDVPAEQIAGVFANDTALDNSGEQLQLLDAAGGVIRDFTYNDEEPWPRGADGDGPSLVLRRPESNPDHSNAANWRPSAGETASPGTVEALTYSGWAAANGVTDLTGAADDDGDGISNFGEYARGTNPKVVSSGADPVVGAQNVSVGSGIAEYVTLTYQRPVGRDDAAYIVEGSTDLGTWTPAVLVGSRGYKNGIETLTYRFPQPMSGAPAQFLRLRTTRLP